MNRMIKNIIIWLVLIFFIAISALIVELEPIDEFTNYYNAYKIYNGETIYKDVNIVSTPLLFYIALIFFKLLGTGLITFRIYNIFINILILIFIYKIFINLKIEKEYSIIYTIILDILIIAYVTVWGATYNALALLMCLIGLNCYINNKNIKYYEFKFGLILFLIIMTKQNIGIFYSIAYVLAQLITNKKQGFKNILKTFSITIVLLITYLAHLYAVGNLDNFVSYTILGIREFSGNVLILAIDNILIDLLYVFFVFCVILKHKYLKEHYESLIILYVFGICMLGSAYPIADRWHTIIASFILLVCMIYTVHTVIIIELEIKQKSLYKIIFVIITIIFLFGIIKFIKYTSMFCKDKDNKFYLIPISEDRKNAISRVEEYICDMKDNKIIIASPEAGMYKINLNKSGDGIFDMPYKGNFGAEGEKGLIDRISRYKETYILIHTQKKYWQESDEFREFVENEYKKVGNINDFSIYYIK